MANDICKNCGKNMYGFNQINNVFFVCINPKCELEGLLKIDLKKSIENQKRYQKNYAM